MPFTGTNDYITGRKPVPTSQGAEVIATRFELAMTAADLALNNIGQIGVLPAGHIPVDVYIDGTDMDSGAGAGVYQVGILNADGTAISTAAANGGGAWGDTGAAVATAFYKRMTATLNNMATVQASNVDRMVAVRVTTAPSTAVAGTMGVTVLSRPA